MGKWVDTEAGAVAVIQVTDERWTVNHAESGKEIGAVEMETSQRFVAIPSGKNGIRTGSLEHAAKIVGYHSTLK